MKLLFHSEHQKKYPIRILSPHLVVAVTLSQEKCCFRILATPFLWVHSGEEKSYKKEQILHIPAARKGSTLTSLHLVFPLIHKPFWLSSSTCVWLHPFSLLIFWAGWLPCDLSSLTDSRKVTNLQSVDMTSFFFCYKSGCNSPSTYS